MSIPVTPSHTTARVPMKHKPTLLLRAAAVYSKRAYGAVLDPGLALWHNQRVLRDVMRFEGRVAKWSALPVELRELTTLAVAAQIGCSWCIDFGYFNAQKAGMPEAKLRALPTWRESELFSPLERKVLEYADAQVAALREDLTDAQLIELTALVSLENFRTRTNDALGLTSQGFSPSCELASAHDVSRSTT